MSDLVPAVALAVLRDQHADEVRHLKTLVRRGEDHGAEIARLTAEVKLLKARVANAESAAHTANGRAKTAQVEAEAVRQHIAERLRVEARTVNRRWAGCYRHIANQLDTPRRTR